MSQTELPAFVAELEALEAKATPGPWIADFNDLHSDSVWIAEFQSGFDDLDYTVALRNHGPALLALVRQLQGESAALKIQASKYAYECELAKRERDRAEARFHSLMTEGKITSD